LDKEMSKILIAGGPLHTPFKVFKQGAVLIHGGKIQACGSREAFPIPEDCEIIDAQGMRIIPGLIDVHLHGMAGMDAGGPDLYRIIQLLPQHGITTFLPTTYAGTRTEIEAAIEAAVKILEAPPPGAQAIGIHMEGPWLSPARSGMSAPQHLYPLTQPDIEAFWKIAKGHIRMVTFAPEQGEALQVIPWLAAHGIIPSVGHTDADYDTIACAVAMGVNHATHTYNAMRGLHHREPGALGAVMDHNEIIAEIIADGHHVHPAAIRILVAAKGVERLCLVSDATPPAGAPPGTYDWMGYKLIHDGRTSRLENGTLAGSVTLINQMLQVLVDEVGLSFAEALQMATATPGMVLGLRKGIIAPGYDADIVILNNDYQADISLVNGEVVYKR
jgi:N-acetylglucosamine-6-phosphate deacetylase